MRFHSVAKTYFNRSTLFYLLLALPLATAFLPQFWTSFEEDLLLLIVFGYLFFRALEPKRRRIADEWQAVLIVGIAGTVYAIAWIGFVRGYGDAWGRWAAFFPICMIAALFFRPQAVLPRSRSYRQAVFCIIFFTIILFGMLWLAHRYKTPEDSFITIVNVGSLIPPLMVFPILGCLLLLSCCFGRLERGRDHVLLLIPLALITFSVWKENATTWLYWYRAGELERAWTPFKHDAVSEPDLVAAAERKPYEAARYYQLVYDRIQKKGTIPQLLNWPFFMRFRMATQAMRKEDALQCARFLPPSDVTSPDKIELIKNQLWHLDLFQDMQVHESLFEKRERVLVDYAMSPDRKTAYALDRWGRVYSYVEDTLWREWSPAESFNDAQHLTILNDVFIVRRKCGRLHISKNTLNLEIPPFSLMEGHHIIGMKSFRSVNTVILYTNYGEIFPCGKLPDGFPPYSKLFFDRPVIADLEIDLNEQGYYLLDRYGAIHSNHRNGQPLIPHTSPPVAKELLPYWAEQDMAVDLALDPSGRGMYVYNRLGEVFSLAVSPYRETYRPAYPHPDRGVELGIFADGTLVGFESNGGMVIIP
jgi:hypothetical protein